jgi:hypothetical protein
MPEVYSSQQPGGPESDQRKPFSCLTTGLKGVARCKLLIAQSHVAKPWTYTMLPTYIVLADLAFQ